MYSKSIPILHAVRILIVFEKALLVKHTYIGAVPNPIKAKCMQLVWIELKQEGRVFSQVC